MQPQHAPKPPAHAPSPIIAFAPHRQTALWVVAVLLAFIAGMMFTSSSAQPVLPAGISTALAQNPPAAGARGIFAFTGQLDGDTHGLFMMDVDAGTVWCYEIDAVDGVRKLKLVAARSWVYDRLLKDFNVLSPSYLTVKDLVARERTAESTAAAPPPVSNGEPETDPN